MGEEMLLVEEKIIATNKGYIVFLKKEVKESKNSVCFLHAKVL